MTCTTHSRRPRLAVFIGVCATMALTPVLAEDDTGVPEEVIVTAQRTAEGIQDVPIAVTALTGDMLEDRQVIGPSDLQMNAPSVSFTATNFGNSSFSIRGIGRLVISTTGEAGVSTHINQIPVATNLNAIEFFDMERVEILRGPQGTLYGRNATGGTINFVTAMPDFDELDGFLDVEVGDYGHQRVKGALNVPLGDNAGLRVAGFTLERDGYIDNLAHGQVGATGNTLQGIDGDIDGRDILAWRTTFAWNVSDRANLWVQYHRFEEDDDRARFTNQVCVRNRLPTTGCVPDAFGFESPHLGSSTSGIFGGAAGALPPGVDGSDPALYAFARPHMDSFREVPYGLRSAIRRCGGSLDRRLHLRVRRLAAESARCASDARFLFATGLRDGRRPHPGFHAFQSGRPLAGLRTGRHFGRRGLEVRAVQPPRRYRGRVRRLRSAGGPDAGVRLRPDGYRIRILDRGGSRSVHPGRAVRLPARCKRLRRE